MQLVCDIFQQNLFNSKVYISINAYLVHSEQVTFGSNSVWNRGLKDW